MAKPVLGKSERSDWFFLGRDCAIRTVSMKTVQLVYIFESRQIQNLHLNLREPTTKTKKMNIHKANFY